jgi:hypothetical protein
MRVETVMPCINVWCEDVEFRPKIARTLEAEGLDVMFPDDWSTFEHLLSNSACSVLVMSDPPSERVLELLLPTDAAGRALERTQSIVVIRDGSTIDSPGLISSFHHGTITRVEVARMLSDAILRESARAALRLAMFRAHGNAILPDGFRRAVILMCQADPPAASVQAAAAIASRDDSTMRGYWRNAHMTELSLKRYVDVVLLLAARARKSVALKWSDVAREYDIGMPRLRAVAHREMGCWPGNGQAVAWLAFARRFRDDVDRMFPVAR